MAKKVDLTKLNVNDKLNIIENVSQSPSFQVVLCLSGYTVSLKPLNYRDIIKITNQNLSNHEQQKTLFNTIYHKIDWSIAAFKPTFEEFLGSTCYFDYNTLLYGLYCATYPQNNEYEITCNNPDCGKVIKLKVPASSLIQVFDKKTMQELNSKILKEAVDKKHIDDFSFLRKPPSGIQLDSGKVIALREPSLLDVLELIRLHNDIIEQSSPLITNILIMTDYILLPTKDGDYTKITDTKLIFDVINEMHPADIDAIKEELEKKAEERHIGYAIKNVKCPHCGTVIKTVDVNIEDILFPRLFEVAS